MVHELRLFALAAFVAMPAVLSAQGRREPSSRGMSAGVSLPTGDLKASLSTGFSVAAHYLTRQGTIPRLRFRVDASLDRWTLQNSTESYRSLGGIMNALYTAPTAQGASLKPYALVGLGVFHASGSSFRQSETNFGMQGGLGTMYPLAGVTTFLEARYVSVFADGRNLIRVPIVFGVRF